MNGRPFGDVVYAMSRSQYTATVDNLDLRCTVICMQTVARASDGRAATVHKVLAQRVDDAREPRDNVIVFPGTRHHNPGRLEQYIIQWSAPTAIFTQLPCTHAQKHAICTPYLEDQQDNRRIVRTENEAGENRGLFVCAT